MLEVVTCGGLAWRCGGLTWSLGMDSRRSGVPETESGRYMVGENW